MSPRIDIVGQDHYVLVVKDVEASIAFYNGTLGLALERVDEWRAGDVSFPSVRIDASTIIDLFAGVPSGTNVDHVAFEVVAGIDLEAWAASVDVEIVEGPASRWGARGDGTSIYVLDPDGNTVELKQYG